MPHDIYSRDATVYLVSGRDKFDALQQAVAQSEFVAHLLAQWQSSGKAQTDFLVAIKPNIMTASIHEPDSPVYTDPALVEMLIGVMRAQGFSQFAVVETENVYNYSYRGRRVSKVAEMCGYTGDGYRIVDLSDETAPLDYGGLLGRHVVGRTWLEADYRISFAKNKSHWQCYYTGCIKNVYGCLPEWDKMRHYHIQRRGRRIDFYDAAVLIADRLPVHFGFLDAWVSGDGLTGHVHDANPNPTHMIIASENIFALDWVAGEKMQINPLDNYVMQRAVSRWGVINITRLGDMTPWQDWDNVRTFFVKTLDVLQKFYRLSRFMSRALAARMDPRFKPVSRFQWFFKVTHAIVQRVEGLSVKPAPPTTQPRLVAMTQPSRVGSRPADMKSAV
ncbi:MAG: DUF362 domain-containing protein [Chloroflexi bacterium]|nr:DUF362 domain-containing protein [Chloroflexota bacterium]